MTIKEFGEKLWGGLIHYYSEDIVTSSVTEEDQIALAQKLQDMGYDVVGYGFADASYEYDNEENAGDIDGFTNGTITGISTASLVIRLAAVVTSALWLKLVSNAVSNN